MSLEVDILGVPNLTHDFLESRKKVFRYRKFVLPVLILIIVAALTAGGLYFYQKKAAKPQSGEVAAANSSNILPKDWLLKYFGTDNENDPKVGGPNGDPDNDLLTNQKEFLFGTDPTKEDTDGDGGIDSFEVAFGKNPNGEGEFKLTEPSRDYVKEYIASHQEFKDISEEAILKDFENLLKPDRAVVMDFPQDSELVIIEQNDKESFEKYFNETQSLSAADEAELQKIQNDLFSLSADDLNFYIKKLQSTTDLLTKVPVPSKLLNIHRLKIAGLRAGIRMFELVRDNYEPNAAEEANQKFLADLFYQTVIAENAGVLELAAWREIGQILKDQGGL